MIYLHFGLQKKIMFADLSFQIKGYGEISIILPLLKNIYPQIGLSNHLSYLAQF